MCLTKEISLVTNQDPRCMNHAFKNIFSERHEARSEYSLEIWAELAKLKYQGDQK
jgi:hypothetical protein